MTRSSRCPLDELEDPLDGEDYPPPFVRHQGAPFTGVALADEGGFLTRIAYRGGRPHGTCRTLDLEGLTRKADAGRVIDAWAARKFLPCVSTALALEYEEILLRRFPVSRHSTVQAALQALLNRAEYVPILSRVRPLSPDPDDDFVIECAFNSASSIVTRNLRDFRVAQKTLGIVVLDPTALLALLEE